jgi:PPK2 family polyphosphate:nucleotide phosphotransferase
MSRSRYHEAMKNYRVREKSDFKLADMDPDQTAGWADKAAAREATAKLLEKIQALQQRLYAEHKQSLLVVLQAMDTGGKDGTIRKVFSGVNPAGCRVVAFKAPTAEELSHDFLWRIHKEAPAKGIITVFNRSHYEDVLITRVHRWISEKVAVRRLKQIRHFEHLLSSEGTRVVKFFLHISKEEQKRRLEERLADQKKWWKVDLKDLEERKEWKRYMRVYEEVIRETSTEESPWYVVPADHKWYRDWVIAKVVAETLEEMNPRFPATKGGVDFRKVRVI